MPTNTAQSDPAQPPRDADLPRRYPENGASPNTVYLSREDGNRLLRPRRVAVLGVLDAVVGHLALDGTGVGAWAPCGEELEEQFVASLVMRGGQCLRGKNPRGRRWCGARRGGCG